MTRAARSADPRQLPGLQRLAYSSQCQGTEQLAGNDPQQPQSPGDASAGERGAGRERRRVDRSEGLKLLFAGAQDFARQQGALAEGRLASFEHSVVGRSSYTLRDANDKIISRVALVDARAMLSFRRQLARQLLSGVKVEILKESTVQVERRQIRLQKEQVRALSWAIGAGRRFPYPPSETRQGLITLGLLLCCLVPGFVYYFKVVRGNRERYERNLNELVRRWRDLGRPDPPASFFALYDLP